MRRIPSKRAAWAGAALHAAALCLILPYCIEHERIVLETLRAHDLPVPIDGLFPELATVWLIFLILLSHALVAIPAAIMAYLHVKSRLLDPAFHAANKSAGFWRVELGCFARYHGALLGAYGVLILILMARSLLTAEASALRGDYSDQTCVRISAPPRIFEQTLLSIPARSARVPLQMGD